MNAEAYRELQRFYSLLGGLKRHIQRLAYAASDDGDNVTLEFIQGFSIALESLTLRSEAYLKVRELEAKRARLVDLIEEINTLSEEVEAVELESDCNLVTV